MNSKVETILKKTPGIRNLINKIRILEDENKQLVYEMQLMANYQIDLRLREKKLYGEKVNIIFVCHRPAVWESLHSVYDAFKASEKFQVTIVAIPIKKEIPGLWLNHEIYETEGAEEFWHGENCIEGYNYITHEWLDLRSLHPDYIFFQQPYNIARPPLYNSRIVSKYAKIAYVSYFSPLCFDEVYKDCTPEDYLDDLSFFFTHNEKDFEYIQDRFLSFYHDCKIINTGFPRYDYIMTYHSERSDIWNKRDTFKILWTPRWTTNEGNCHFFQYKDKFVEYCKDNKDVEFVFRPHPQAFSEWESTGELNKQAREKYLQNYCDSNMHLDLSKNYYPLLFSSDCLIADRSTIILDYFCTLKPVIYCKSNTFSELIPEYYEGVYIVNNWEEMVKTIQMLRNGKDPLIDKRKEIVFDFMNVGKQRAADSVCKAILDDAMK